MYLKCHINALVQHKSYKSNRLTDVENVSEESEEGRDVITKFRIMTVFV